MPERYLKCKIYKGMFSTERAVEYRDANGETSSVFVPKDSVIGSIDEEGKVRVRFFNDGAINWVVLPTDDQMIVPVNELDLVNQ